MVAGAHSVGSWATIGSRQHERTGHWGKAVVLSLVIIDHDVRARASPACHWRKRTNQTPATPSQQLGPAALDTELAPPRSTFSRWQQRLQFSLSVASVNQGHGLHVAIFCP
jgi:hypothetical protein